MLSAPSTAIPTQLPNMSTFTPLQGATAMTQNSRDLTQIPSNLNAQYRARSSFPAMAPPDLNTPDIQHYVIERIVKGDDNATHVSAQRLRSFVGYVLRPLPESDYKAGVDLL